jgi:FKBP-type peptidyl-prolyl cis-trans isomerase FkpA
VKLRSVIQLGGMCVAAAALATACSSSPTTPSTEVYSQTDVTVGTGVEATSTSTVVVNYTGWFYDASKTDKKGLQFDTSYGKSPFTLQLGTGAIIEGWERGIPGMRVGGQRRLVIPPSLAYGPNRYGVIPPNATLVFDIDLLEVQ